MDGMDTSTGPAADIMSLSPDMTAFMTDDPDPSLLESITEPGSSGDAENDPVDASANVAHKPYYAKRPHRKSRAGCKQCKKRKVKCDEAKPACRACTLRKEKCVYPNASTTSPEPAVTTAVSSSASSNTLVIRSHSPTPESFEVNPAKIIITEPLFRPGEMADAVDMKMLWFYSTATFHSFSIETGRSAAIDHVLKVKIVEHAFKSPFLMDTIMALTSLHLQSLNQEVPARKAVSYRARAFQGYRTAIEAAKPNDYPALLACSLLMCALSSQMFRDQDAQPLYIIEWMAVWRGIGLIIDIISPLSVQESGIAVLFYRPPIDLEKATQYIPNNLLFMVQNIKYDDPDYEHQKVYYEYLRYLGSLYMELTEHGFSPIMDLRIITFFTFVPRPLIPLAREHRPRILILLAYYLCFAKLVPEGVWWFDGVANQIEQICRILDSSSNCSEWEPLLRVPRMVLRQTDKIEAARLIIDNHNWTPSELDFYHRHRDPRCKTDLKLITDEGQEIDLAEGHWRLKASGIRWQRMQQAQASGDLDPTVRAAFSTDAALLSADGHASQSSSSSASTSTHSPASSGTRAGISPLVSPSP
ncbi:hypothetical protein F5Y15DRAFT_175642 [Xylariaceae sp. FL0016]|nr:hypothetical protein F5Y15DRAFT_175642 [Xylariaceae sp. FL0016]